MDSIRTLFTQSPFVQSQVENGLWLIPALPLFGALICGLFSRLLGRANTALVACGAIAGSFVLSIIAFWTTVDARTVVSHVYSPLPVGFALSHKLGTWFSAGDFTATFGLWVDHLSGPLLLVITGVGLLIHIYSASYMSHDEGYGRYFAYLNLFVAMMLTLVMADSLVLLFVGWEGVGLCSYLLIGFWYTDSAKAWAGRKAFITNRIGDFAFLLGMFLLVLWVGAFERQASANFGASPVRTAYFKAGLKDSGPLNFRALEEIAKVTPKTKENAPIAHAQTLADSISSGPLAGWTFGGVLTAILLLFLLGAAGKSAQLPLYVWLPDAMAGPTPVSALIHAATMVTAGVYLFCRLSFLLVLSPTAMAAVALIGGLTALFAAVIAFAQNDIKKVLAYSTVSQLGLMFLGVGMGVFWAAVFHLVTHAFFKACLFLGAGSVMHGNDDETDIRKLGGLRHEMKWTWATFAIASIAATGVLPLSGFFSKDAILHGVHSTTLPGYEWVTPVAWVLGLATAVCTAFYMTRLYLLTFEGKRSPEAKIAHAHESDGAMTMPLVVLASLAVVALVYGLPVIATGSQGHQTLMENFLGSVFRTTNDIVHAQHLFTVDHSGGLWGAWILAIILAWVGAGSAFFLYTKFFPARKGALEPAWMAAPARWAYDKFYVDEIYDRVILRPIKWTATLLFKLVDAFFIDTVAVRGTAWVTARTGAVLRFFQTGDVQSYAAVMALALVGAAALALF